MATGNSPRTRPQRCSRRGITAVLALATALLARADAPVPPFLELRELVRTHAPAIPETELDAVVASALLAKVRGRVLTPGETAEPISDEPAIVDKKILEGCAYIRVGQVTLALAPQLAAALQNPEFASSRGLVLDLRFSGGSDYLAAANVVDRFLNTETTTLIWGDNQGVSTVKSNAWTRPVAVLLNHDTRGAAEALAAALRQQRLGILIGGRTAGSAAVFKEVPLKSESGNRLRLAVAPVKTADGQVLPASGIESDIQVAVRPEHDRAYLADPYTIALSSGPGEAGSSATHTNSHASSPGVPSARKRVSEADLVRQKLEVDAAARGGSPVPPTALPTTRTNAPESAPRPTASESGQVIKDPVLGRAIDLLKGLSLLSSKQP